MTEQEKDEAAASLAAGIPERDLAREAEERQSRLDAFALGAITGILAAELPPDVQEKEPPASQVFRAWDLAEAMEAERKKRRLR